MAKYRITIETDSPEEIRKVLGGGQPTLADVIKQAYTLMIQMELEAIKEFGEPGVKVSVKAPAIPEIIRAVMAMGETTVRLGGRQRTIRLVWR